ncbi:hypothetical protein HK102_001218, partial [Quaeritorhiza haematococci]
MAPTALKSVLNQFTRRLPNVAGPAASMVHARCLATVAPAQPNQKYSVVVIGGGAGGLAVASLLGKSPKFQGKKNILVIEPSETHYYQPLWTFVGAGLKTLKASEGPMKAYIPEQADWLKQTATKIDPTANVVVTSDGKQINYDYLVVASGIQINWDKIPGLQEALKDDKVPVASNYSKDFVEKTNKLIRAFRGGNAVFTQPATPIKCAGAPQKIVYLAEEIFRENDVRSKTQITFNTGMGKIFSVDKYADELWKICKDRDIQVNLLTDLIEVRPDTKEAVFKKTITPSPGTSPIQTTITQPFDMLHVTPPMGPPTWLKATQLTNTDGWVDVSKTTLQHNRFPNVFSLGDSSSLPTSKTAAAAASQSGVLVNNLLKVIEGREGKDVAYGGYTSCPLITGKGKLILAEFDYDLKPYETFPFDQGKQRSSMYYMVAD